MSATETRTESYVGTSIRRVEDTRILTGRGRYVDDIRLPDALHAVFVRSPLPHARITGIDISAARAMPGVIAVITGEELNAATAPLHVGIPMPNYLSPEYRPLASNRVRYAGDPIVMIVAESRYLAEDARDAVVIDYEPLKPIATPEHAQDEARPAIFDELGTNVIFREVSAFGDPDAAFASAAHVVRHRIHTGRATHVPLEGRTGLAEFHAGTNQLVYHAGTQAPHAIKMGLAAALLHPADCVRVVAPDVGGAFGQKDFLHREDVAICHAARLLQQPVKWIEDRSESLVASVQARNESLEVAAAVAEDGTILALDVTFVLDHGAYPIALPTAVFANSVRTMFPGPYRIDNLRWNATIVMTNKATFGPYRGPWACEALARETLFDRIAIELGLEPTELRRRNLVGLDEQPRPMTTGPTLEGVAAQEALDRAAELADLDAFRSEQRKAREEGRLLGLGIATFIEPAPGPPDYYGSIGFPPVPERAVAQLELDGNVTISTSQAPHGQSHETTLAQVAASELGVPLETVRITHGDTTDTPFSLIGTGGSRAATMATGAVLHATRQLKQKLFVLAAMMLEMAPEELVIVNGSVCSAEDPSRAMPLAALAQVSYFAPPEGEEPGLRTSATFNCPPGGWSGGTHACVVEVDPETGVVQILRYIVVEDCGRLINPAVVDGQIRGGIAQGIGLALFEDAVYDEEATPLAATFMDYLLPTAMEIPAIEIEHLETEPLHEVDFRGVGEGGTILAPPTVVNAIFDALGGVPVERIPLTPARVLALIDARPGA